MGAEAGSEISRGNGRWFGVGCADARDGQREADSSDRLRKIIERNGLIMGCSL